LDTLCPPHSPVTCPRTRLYTYDWIAEAPSFEPRNQYPPLETEASTIPAAFRFRPHATRKNQTQPPQPQSDPTPPISVIAPRSNLKGDEKSAHGSNEWLCPGNFPLPRPAVKNGSVPLPL